MNEKFIKFVKLEGFCCRWAFLEANRAKLTSVLMKELVGVCTVRALQYHRAQHRHGETKCENYDSCLKRKIKEGFPLDLNRKTP